MFTHSSTPDRQTKTPRRKTARRKNSAAKIHARRETVGFLLWDTQRAIARDFERLITPHGVTRSTFWILRILWEEDRKTQVELAKRCRMKGPTIVGIVAQLEREKLVTRTVDPNDNRKKVISLTTKGSELRHKIIPTVEDVNRRAVKGLSAAQRDQLKEMLRLIRSNME